MNATRTLAASLALALSVLLIGPAQARNIDLATVPPRDSVQLTIYNSEDLTLVRETRSLTLKKGLNRIQYSWANTLIDPTSVEIRPLEKEGEIEVLDTTYPGDKPQHCIWNIKSEFEGQARFLVTYFTSGLSWSADYVLVTDKAESEMSFDGYVQIFNNSGEEYENAQVRLVVGVVNLVEKIQDLARRGNVPPVAERMLRLGAMKDALARAEPEASRPAPATKPHGQAPEIVKEGLSEYFIYTIEGEQTIPHQWSKRLASFAARQVKFEILYRLRPAQYGPRPVRFFMLKNDEEHKLGTTPLPDGLVRTFRDNGRDGMSFLGQQSTKYVPIKEDIELNVGLDDQVVEENKCMAAARSNFTFDFNHDPPRVVGWDEKRAYKDEVRNYRPRPIRMEIWYVIDGDVELTGGGAKLHDYRTAEFAVDVKANTKFNWQYEYVRHCGTNAKQSRIVIQETLDR